MITDAFLKNRAKAVPKAPMLTAKSREDPARMAGASMGKRTFRRTVTGPAPRDTAASTRLQLALLHAAVMVRIILGMRKYR